MKVYTKAIEIDTLVGIGKIINYTLKSVDETSAYCSGKVKSSDLYTYNSDLLDYFIGVL